MAEVAYPRSHVSVYMTIGPLVFIAKIFVVSIILNTACGVCREAAFVGPFPIRHIPDVLLLLII